MAVLVQKYGGSSVEDLDKVMKVAERVAGLRARGNDLVVVVSAQGRMTDSLLRDARSITPEPAQRELDMLVTAGERISMSLLSIALNSLGCRAVSFTGSQVGIITDTRHTNARILEVRPHRLVRELERGSVVVVGGFQGVSTDKEVTTLGRGGSDTTAVALAAALGAERCDILTDVDGVYTADPRLVPGAKRIEEIGYGDMAELARYGATVLKEEAVRFAEQVGIAIRVGGAERPEPGTIVLERPLEAPRSVVAMSLQSDVSLLRTGLPGRGAEVDDPSRYGDAVRFVAACEGSTVAAIQE
ncbi:MAG: aspartate kinase, partial [Candidatus Eisenbacteria bacterium]|nr:aspartate kinase [Candidatus Eisenbacteria bacterium]